MRRPVFRRTATGMALFPFLAVLICTMGALIVLLVLILQQSRAQASIAATEQQAADAERRASDREDNKQRRELLEDVHWRREVLDQQRQQQTEDLARSRLELSHLEDHIRRLQDQAKRLGAQLNPSATQQTDEEQQKLVEQIKTLQDEIAAARQKLESAQLAASKKNKSFTIIPYEGRNGTRRRPIYIECAEEGIILHPENIVFSPNDFEGPLGPGNPLDAALRTVREYLARYGSREEVGEPYPLLVVRPNGAMAYSMARAAMKSWDDEFGYELIDGETSLQFPPADPQLEELLLRTIKDARQRQVALAAAMPSRYRVGHIGAAEESVPAQSFAAANSQPVAKTSANGSGLGTNPAPNSRGNGQTSGVGQEGGDRSGTGGATGYAAGKGRGRGVGEGTGTVTGTESGQGSGSGTGSGTGRGSGNGSGSGSGDERGNAANSTGAPSSVASDSNRSPGTGGASAGGSAAGGSASGGSGTGGSSNAAGGASAGGGSGGTGGTAAGASSGAAMPGQVGGGGGAGINVGSSGGTSGGGRGAGGGKFTANGSATHADGEWALPTKPQFATAITRPIRVRCEPKQLVILPERGDAKRVKVVPIPGPFSASLDDVVIAIRRHMDGWGLAVKGGYWKPVLNVTVAPGAESQFVELESTLRGSGVEVVRK